MLKDQRWLPPTVDVYTTSDLTREGVWITGNVLKVVQVHTFDGEDVPCTGRGCWHCEDRRPKRSHGYISAVLPPRPRRRDQPEHCLIFLDRDCLCDALVSLCPEQETFRGLGVFIRSLTMLQRTRVDQAPDFDLPRPIDPLPYMVRRWGSHVEFLLLAPCLTMPFRPDDALQAAGGKAVWA